MATNPLTITAQGEREILMTRGFDAPRRLVFDAWTKPALVPRWLGAMPGWTFATCDIDLRVGGAYRFVMRHDDGKEMGWGGIYREIAAPDRLVFTERFDEAWYPGECLVSNTLTEHEARTTLSTILLYESRAARDAVLASPMEKGIEISYAKMDELLADLARST